MPTGYNTYWLILTSISLVLAGGYFIFRQKRKYA
ncbi:MAG: LPXTG cell wall anchor domain-containing protein [Actinobacteria bacterium]|nr:LPXTG cell wall anchor domain-containing protein [Actinomycetota bacterium]